MCTFRCGRKVFVCTIHIAFTSTLASSIKSILPNWQHKMFYHKKNIIVISLIQIHTNFQLNNKKGRGWDIQIPFFNILFHSLYQPLKSLRLDNVLKAQYTINLAAH